MLYSYFHEASFSNLSQTAEILELKSSTSQVFLGGPLEKMACDETPLFL